LLTTSRSKGSEQGRKLRHGENVRKKKLSNICCFKKDSQRRKIKLMATSDPELKASLRRKKAEEIKR